jgi:ribose transport system ATP-binding protein
VDLDIHAGEIVGIGGLYGSGRSELLRLIGGMQPATAGEVEIFGRRGPRSPHEAAQHGVGYVAEGRKRMLFQTMSVSSNATIAVLRRLNPVFVRKGRERKLVAGVASDMDLVGRLDAPVGTLSGGNQQKVGLARWLLREAALLLLDEPTVGIDVHARAEIHNLLRALAERGKTIIVASAEPEELVLLCDRVLVMIEGSLERELGAPFDADSVVAASYRAVV